MTVLVDHQIIKLCEEGLVSPFDKSLVNPCSLDIRVGETMKLMKVTSKYKYLQVSNKLLTIENREGLARELQKEVSWEDINLKEYSKDNPFWMFHGEKVLVASLETFNLPNNLCAQFRLKSSRGREFYEHLEAGFCDPGWNRSKLTMEIEGRNLAPLPLYPGLRMGQLIFSWTSDIPDNSYAVTGRYNNDSTVKESKSL